MRVVDRLGSLQFDPLEVAGRNHDLTLLARIAGYRRAVDGRAAVPATACCTRPTTRCSRSCPTAELPWYRITWDRAPRGAPRRRVRRARAARRGAARRGSGPSGPLSSTDVEPRAAIDWYWRPTNQVRALLEALARGRDHRDRPPRGQPPRLRPDRAPVPGRPARAAAARARAAPAQAAVALPRQRAAGRDRGVHAVGRDRRDAASARALRDELVETGAITPVAVEGLRGQRFVRRRRAADAGRGGGRGRGARPAGAPPRPAGCEPGVAFLAPLDPLAWDRDLLLRLFGLRLPLGGLRAGGQAPLGLLRPAAAVRRPVRGPHRAADRPRRRARCGCSGCGGRTGSIRWMPAHPGFVDAFAAALRAHVAFAGLRKVALPRVARHRALARGGPGAALSAVRRQRRARRAPRGAPERLSRRRAGPPDHPGGDRLVAGLVDQDERARRAVLRGTGRRTAAASRAAGSGRSR